MPPHGSVEPIRVPSSPRSAAASPRVESKLKRQSPQSIFPARSIDDPYPNLQLQGQLRRAVSLQSHIDSNQVIWGEWAEVSAP
mmetsp:Transcript_134072/g.232768  ORF Transcript_134072/g.232768 Transcript_134072/m.232768 type:complete len:83 (+) Transcript_134072:183-431(+)